MPIWMPGETLLTFLGVVRLAGSRAWAGEPLFEKVKRVSPGTVFYPMAPNAPIPCVVMVQDGDRVATVLFQIDDNLITRIDLCQIPPPESCVGTGEYPGISGSGEGEQA